MTYCAPRRRGSVSARPGALQAEAHKAGRQLRAGAHAWCLRRHVPGATGSPECPWAGCRTTQPTTRSTASPRAPGTRRCGNLGWGHRGSTPPRAQSGWSASEGAWAVRGRCVRRWRQHSARPTHLHRNLVEALPCLHPRLALRVVAHGEIGGGHRAAVVVGAPVDHAVDQAEHGGFERVGVAQLHPGLGGGGGNTLPACPAGWPAKRGLAGTCCTPPRRPPTRPRTSTNWGMSAGARPPGGRVRAHSQLGSLQFFELQWYQSGMAAGGDSGAGGEVVAARNARAVPPVPPPPPPPHPRPPPGMPALPAEPRQAQRGVGGP